MAEVERENVIRPETQREREREDGSMERGQERVGGLGKCALMTS